jgi:hypothetical protein
MSAENAPTVASLAECPRTAIPAVVTREFVSKDDSRAPSIHCTNIAVAGGVRFSTWFGGSYEGATDNKIWYVYLQARHFGHRLMNSQVLQKQRQPVDRTQGNRRKQRW